MIPWWRSDFGEAEVTAASMAIRSGNISSGPKVEQFEAELADLLGVKHVVACSSGTAALFLALKTLQYEAGILSITVRNRAWRAIEMAADMADLDITVVDEGTDGPMQPVSVHLNGREDTTIKDSYLLEDASQALMSRSNSGELLGTRALMGCFSFAVTKLVSTGQGGAVVTQNGPMAKTLRQFRDAEMGYNMRMTNTAAAIGLVQLGRVEERIRRMESIYETYYANLRDIPFLWMNSRLAGQVPLYAEAYTPHRDALIRHLAERDIEAVPVHPNLRPTGMGVSMKMAREGLYLPCGPEQPMKNVTETIRAIKEFGSLKEVA